MIFLVTYVIIFNDRFNHAERSYDSIERRVKLGGVVTPKIVVSSLKAVAASGSP